MKKDDQKAPGFALLVRCPSPYGGIMQLNLPIVNLIFEQKSSQGNRRRKPKTYKLKARTLSENNEVIVQTPDGDTRFRLSGSNIRIIRDAITGVKTRKGLDKGRSSGNNPLGSKLTQIDIIQKVINQKRERFSSLSKTAIIKAVSDDNHISESTIWRWIKKGRIKIPPKKQIPLQK